MNAKFVLEKHAQQIGIFNNYYHNELNQISETYIIRIRFDQAVFCFIMT